MGRATGTGRTSLTGLDALRAMLDMGAGALRGATTTTLGTPGDLAELASEAQFPLTPSGQLLQAIVRPSARALGSLLPTSERVSELLPPGPSTPFEALGRFAPVTPGQMGRLVRPALRAAGEGLNAAMLSGEGALARAFPAAMPMNVIKPRGGQWLGGSVENELNRLRTPISPTLKDDAARSRIPWTDQDEIEQYQSMFPELAKKRRLDEGFAHGGLVADPARRIIEEHGGKFGAGGLVKGVVKLLEEAKSAAPVIPKSRQFAKEFVENQGLWRYRKGIENPEIRRSPDAFYPFTPESLQDPAIKEYLTPEEIRRLENYAEGGVVRDPMVQAIIEQHGGKYANARSRRTDGYARARCASGRDDAGATA